MLSCIVYTFNIYSMQMFPYSIYEPNYRFHMKSSLQLLSTALTRN